MQSSFLPLGLCTHYFPFPGTILLSFTYFSPGCDLPSRSPHEVFLHRDFPYPGSSCQLKATPVASSTKTGFPPLDLLWLTSSLSDSGGFWKEGEKEELLASQSWASCWKPLQAWPQPHPPLDHVSAVLSSWAGPLGSPPASALVQSRRSAETRSSLCSLSLTTCVRILLTLLFCVCHAVWISAIPLCLCVSLCFHLCLSPFLHWPPLSLPLLLPSLLPSCLSPSCPPTSFSLCLSPPSSCSLSGSGSKNTSLSLAPHLSEGSSGPFPCLYSGAWSMGAFLQWGPRCGVAWWPAGLPAV